MGVPGLKSFVSSNVSLKRVTSADFNGLVVDGKSLIYHLTFGFHLTCTFGGQYPKLERILEDFFNALLSNGIDVKVVFDGLDYDELKCDTKLKRKKRSYSDIRGALRMNKELDLLAPLTDLVFCHVLRKLKIPFIFVDGDADQKIAQIANFHHYPVIADDSDYYIFDLCAGYMPLHTFEWEGGTVSALLYKRDFLVESVGFHSPDLVLGIPLFIGNDFYNAVIRSSLGRTLQGSAGRGQAAKNVRLTIDFLTQFSSLIDCITELPRKLDKPDPAGVQTVWDGLELMQCVYDALPPFISDPIAEIEVSALMPQKDGRPVPKELLHYFRKGLADMITLEALCKEYVDLPTAFEDLMQPCCYNIGEPLRATLYALVHLDQDELVIKEQVRCHPYNDNFKFASVKVIRSSVLPMVPSTCNAFRDVRQLPLDTRKGVIMHCLEVPPSTAEIIQSLDPSFHLLALVTRYWYCHAVPKPRPLELKALIVCLLIVHRGTRHKVHRFNLRTTHSCVQWQKVFKDIHDLNNLLSKPFPPLPPISEIFDGQLLHFLTRDLPLQDEGILRTYRVDRDHFHGLVSIANDKVQNVMSVSQARETSVAQHQSTKTTSSAPLHQIENTRSQSEQHSQTTQATNAEGRSTQRSQTTQATNAEGRSKQHSQTTQATNAEGRSTQRSQTTQATNAEGQSTQHSQTTQATNAEGRSKQHSQTTQATNAEGRSKQHSQTTQATNAEGRSKQHSQTTQATNAEDRSKQHSQTTQATNAEGRSKQHSQTTQATNAEGRSKQHSQTTQATNAEGRSTQHSQTTQATNAEGRSKQQSQTTQATNAEGRSKQRSQTTQVTNAEGRSKQRSQTTQATNAEGRSKQLSQTTQATNAEGRSKQHSQTTQPTNAEGRSTQCSQTTQATNAQGWSTQHSRTTKATNARGHSSLQRQPKAKKTGPAASSPHAHTKRHTNTSSVVRHSQPKWFQTPSPPAVPLANRFALLTVDNNASSSDSD